MLSVIFYVMSFLTAFGFLAKLISAFSARGIVKGASQIQKSNHRLIRLVKAKFEHTCMISDKVYNVEAFVDKYIYEYKVLGIRIGIWQRMPIKIIVILALLGAFNIVESYRKGAIDQFLDYVQWTGIFVAFLAILCFITEEKSRLDAAKTYMVEYLENVCMHRYAKKNKAQEEVKEEAQEEVQEEESPVEEERDEKEKNIRAILEEFLA